MLIVPLSPVIAAWAAMISPSRLAEKLSGQHSASPVASSQCMQDTGMKCMACDHIACITLHSQLPLNHGWHEQISLPCNRANCTHVCIGTV